MGRKNAPTPDYGKMRESLDKATEVADRLGTRQLDFAERQYNEMRPLADRAATAQLESMDFANRIAREERDYGLQFRPAERQLLSQAMAFNTDAAREEMASQAAADAARAFGATQAQTARGMSRMGVAPGSGAFGANMNQNALAAASQRAGAMNQTRSQAQDRGNALLYGASALGRGQTQAAVGALGLTGSLAGQGLSSAMAPGGQYMQGMAQGAGTIMQGQGLNVQGQGQIMGTQANLYGQKMGAQTEMLGTAVGVGAAFI